MRPPARYRDPDGPFCPAPHFQRRPSPDPFQETVLLNASVGVQRVMTRLRPTPVRRSPTAATIQRRSLSALAALRAPRSISRPRISGERAVSLTAVGLVAAALAISNFDVTSSTAATGNTSGAGSAPRIAFGGGVDGIDSAPLGIPEGPAGGMDGDLSPISRLSGAGIASTIDGPFAADGTLVKPGSVDTTIADGKDLIRTYRVKSGDTLTGVARHFGVTMMTVWWANHLSSKNELHVGQILVIPPVSGVVVTVAVSDTLETLATRYDVDSADIVEANALADPNLVVGQTLTIPGAHGNGIATPKPKPVARTSSSGSSRTAAVSSSHSSTRPPSQYTGGAFHWPVAGGYISQYFHYGHYAIDIAADPGTKVMAAASGTVIFAGWKNNGGGYQVWIAHGSNLYTTYNHMSAITVGRGQSVSRGQQVGRVGMTGNATGPHLHFEVWRGPVWDGGVRVNPLIYL
jgi:murein DD-endopeptidase MepM/ murein hydrolase activator NlpD